jgi:hypothetical protein
MVNLTPDQEAKLLKVARCFGDERRQYFFNSVANRLRHFRYSPTQPSSEPLTNQSRPAGPNAEEEEKMQVADIVTLREFEGHWTIQSAAWMAEDRGYGRRWHCIRHVSRRSALEGVSVGEGDLTQS